MTINANTSTFDWVQARSECSPAKVFKQLELGARADVEAANKLKAHHRFDFSFTKTNDNVFSVMRAEKQSLASVDFSLDGGEIRVAGVGSGDFTATLTLTNEGECKLKVNKEESEIWQVRKMALEELFFSALESSPKSTPAIS